MSLPKTCMLSCLPESCWSACLSLVVSGLLCAELITAYETLENRRILQEMLRFWGDGGNYAKLSYFTAILICYIV